MWYHLRKRRSKVKRNSALPPDFLGKYQQSRSKYVRLMNVYEEDVSETLEWIEGVTGRRTRAVVATVSELLTFAENTDTKVVILETVAETLALTESPNYVIIQQQIIWTDLVNTVVTAGPTLSRPSGWGWDAGAVSMQTLSSGDGYAEYAIPSLTQNVMFGLSNGNTDENFTDIDFAIYTYANNGNLYVYENGVGYGPFGSYAAGDVLRVSVESGVVKYYQNESLLYTSLVSPTYPLLVDTSLYSEGAYIAGAVLSGAWEILEVITASVSESLAFSEILVIEKVTSTIYNVNDAIGLFEQVAATTEIGSFVQVNTSETLYISESVFAVGTYAVGDTLTFSENFGYERAVSDTLVLTEDHQLEYPLNDLLTLTESATTEYDVAVSDTLNLTEIAYSLTISTCQENFEPEPPLGIRANTTLSYPYSASTHTVTLRNPEFGNKQTQDMSSVIRMTRGGEQITFRDSTWPTIVYLDVSFTRVTRAQRDDFIALLVAAAGDQIKLEDWENRTWKGHIASEPNEVLEMLNNEYELRFKFEGALQ